MVCARKINDEFNIFEGIHHNPIFLIILAIIAVVQILIVQFTQDVFQVARKGLHWHQWIVWLAIGITVWPVNFFTKFLPDRFFPEIGKKKKDKNKVHNVTNPKQFDKAEEVEEQDEIMMVRDDERI